MLPDQRKPVMFLPDRVGMRRSMSERLRPHDLNAPPPGPHVDPANAICTPMKNAKRSAPPLAYTIDDKLSRFNERRNWCEIYNPIDAAMYVLGSVPIAAAFLLVYQMRKVRKQMNEYHLQVGRRSMA